VVVDRCRHEARSSSNHVNYFALLARLTQIDNPEACLLIGIQPVFTENHNPWPCLNYLTRVTDGGHNMAAYPVAIFLYRHNGNASDNDTMRRYIRRVEGKEESRVAAVGGSGGPRSRWLSNKGCRLCHEVAAKVIHETTWWCKKWPPRLAAQVRGDLPCAGDDCGVPKGWEQRTLFCSEDYRLHNEIILFRKAIGIGN
jgi:hypothetical protein